MWAAYDRLDHSKVHGSGDRTLADLVSLVRFAVHEEDELTPYADQVTARFDAWLATQRNAGRAFTEEQLRWLRMIRDQIAASLGIRLDDFAFVPFNQEGGVGRALNLFGACLGPLLDELNQELTA